MNLSTVLDGGLEFGKGRTGNVSLVFALAIVPMLAAIGLAVDYGSVARLRNQMQMVVDDSVLNAVANAPSLEALGDTAQARLTAEFGRIGVNPTVIVRADTNTGTVTATAELTKPTILMGLLGEGSSTIKTMSSAVSGAGGPTDIAIAFDTTGSMAGAKLSNAQAAASDLVDMVFKLPGSSALNPNVHVGLVPFDYHVNVGTGYRNAAWMTVPADWTETFTYTTYAQLPMPNHVTATCSADGTVYDCSYDDYNNYNVTTGTGSYSINHTWNGCVGSQNDPADGLVPATGANPVPGILDVGCSAPLIRLTNDPTVVKTAIAGLTAQNETYIAPGLLWGWRLLSDNRNGPFADGGPAASTAKKLILMTDGANTHSASYPDHANTDVAAADAKLLQICQNMKASGVQIYTIAFDVTDADIIAKLTQCSSGPPFFFNPQTIADMTKAFHKIGADLTQPRLVK